MKYFAYLLLPLFITLYGCSDETETAPTSSSKVQVVVNKKTVNLTQPSIQALQSAMERFNKDILEYKNKGTSAATISLSMSVRGQVKESETSALEKGVPAEICKTLMASLLDIDTLAKHLAGPGAKIEITVETIESMKTLGTQTKTTDIKAVNFGLPEGRCAVSIAETSATTTLNR